ncbi:glycosyltransferase [Aquimarina brevivitae]|uniref:Glycosyltransferase involved in cell wall biosynthesis n=1 Tax=Aquimarina brevivitae TaxID=323412 RepID=A0A4Q7PG13_9FLAO|nr:glycosyltransferase [Aquimarina brevivitae]RZS99295.1 glycosyltransferase involved in cell wall biosynthesis [Aquimarina brevivitae]
MKKKILLCYNYILHYRKPLFNLLAEKYELVVLHSGNKTVEETDKYSELIFPSKEIGPFFIQKGILSEVKKQNYDYIILLFDLRWINTIISIYSHNKNAKLILWGAWLTNSKIANKARLYLSKKADANIFYTQKSRKDFVNMGLTDRKTYVANNTFDVSNTIKSFENKKKNKILFVGSLNQRKQNDILIKAFSNILSKIPDYINLIFIGDGSEKEKLKNIVVENNIEKRVFFAGRLEHVAELESFYREAIVSVSFGQSGLSVLQSLGYGVPFLTKINSISGGEKTNIKHEVNSIFCEDSIKSLEFYLIKLCTDIEYARNLGKNAFQYYSEFCTMKNMYQGFLDAIENTNLSNIDYKE